MTTEQLALNLLIRMREVERDPQAGLSATSGRYGLLWDAVLDEIRAAVPTLDYAAVLEAKS